MGATGRENVIMAGCIGFKSMAESRKIRFTKVTVAQPRSAKGWSPAAGRALAPEQA
jgi:hypothetical protein